MAKSEDFEKASKVLDSINLAVNKYKAAKHKEAIAALSFAEDVLLHHQNHISLPIDVFNKLKFSIAEVRYLLQEEQNILYL